MTPSALLLEKALEYRQLAELEEAAGDEERAAPSLAVVSLVLFELAHALEVEATA